MDVATDMSETERMKAERAAKIALEEERIKAEKEKEAGGGNCWNIIAVLQLHSLSLPNNDHLSLYSISFCIMSLYPLAPLTLSPVCVYFQVPALVPV